MYEDRSGNIWIATSKGLAIYDIDQDYFLNLNFSTIAGMNFMQSSSGDSKVFIDKDSILYFCGNPFLILDLKKNIFKTYSISDVASSKAYFKSDIKDIILSDKKNELFIICKQYIYKSSKFGDPVKILSEEMKNKLDVENASYIHFKHEVLQIFHNNLTITDYEPNTKSILKHTKIEIDNFNLAANEISILKVIYDKTNSYILLEKGLIVCDLNFKNGKFYMYDKYVSTSISSNTLSNIYIDKSNILWISTVKGGASYTDLSNNNFESYFNIPGKENSLPFNDVLSFCEDHQHNLWIGTFSNGIIRYNLKDKIFTSFNNNTKNQKGLDWTVGTAKIVKDKDNNIFIMNWLNGIYKIDSKKNKNLNSNSIQFENILTPNNEYGCLIEKWSLRDMIIDKKNVAWIVSFSSFGIQKIDLNNKKATHFPASPTNKDWISNHDFWCIAEDRNGFKWLGSNNDGLFKIINENTLEFINFKHDEKDKKTISSNHIKCIYASKDGILWLGTGGGGLVAFDTKKGTVIENFDLDNGMSSNTIYGIIEDDDKNLWLTSDYGLIKFNPKNKTFKNFFTSDGLLNDEYSFNSYYKTKSGKLIVGGENGFDILDPNHAETNNTLAIPNIVELKINNKIVNAGEKLNGRTIFSKNLNEIPSIEFTRKENILSFGFSSMHFSNIHANKIAYKLEGINEDWVILPQSKAEASFSNLPGGTYNLLIKAASSNGKWNENIHTLQIIIIADFYETWWFWILIILGIAYAIYRYFKFKNLKNIENKLFLEREIAEKTDEVKKQNAELLLTRAKEKEVSWITENLNLLSSIVSKSQDNLTITSKLILKNLIKISGANSGVFFMYNDEIEPCLLPTALYGPSSEMLQIEKFELNEGVIGACFTTKEWIVINNAPPSYLTINSGLGESKPSYILVIPIKSETIIIGVLELSFFDEVDKKTIILLEKFVEILALNFNSKLLSEKNNINFKKISNEQQNSAAHEEQMRQMIEELTATQEGFIAKETVYLETIKRFESVKTTA